MLGVSTTLMSCSSFDVIPKHMSLITESGKMSTSTAVAIYVTYGVSQFTGGAGIEAGTPYLTQKLSCKQPVLQVETKTKVCASCSILVSSHCQHISLATNPSKA